MTLSMIRGREAAALWRLAAWTLMAAAAALPAWGGSLPTVDGRQTVASVNGEPITVDELIERIGSMHARAEVPSSAIPRPDPSAVLQRIIDARLIVQEARRIGLDESDEVVTRMEMMRLARLKGALVKERTRSITAGDPADVERIYRESVREVSLGSVLFKSMEDARAFVDDTRACADFDTLAEEALKAGKALRHQAPEFLRAATLREDVAAAAATLEPDQISEPFRLSEGIVVVKLFGERYPDDPQQRTAAGEAALRLKQQRAVQTYTDELRARYVKVDAKVLAGLDYEAGKEQFDAYRKDTRVVAEIRGGDPMTVADLTARIEEKFYHGVESAIDRKRINKDIEAILDRAALERATLVEAKRLKIEDSPAFKAGLREEEDGLLFEAFIKKIINPEVKIREAELRTYYDTHKGEFASPEMMRVESLAFERKEDADAAAERLRKGADLKWLRENARGRATKETHEDLLELAGGLYASDAFPDGIREALAGARAEDVRVHAAPGGPAYVLVVRQVTSSAPQPYDAARESVSVKVYQEKRQAVMADWVKKLRDHSEITIHAKDGELRTILGLGPASGT